MSAKFSIEQRMSTVRVIRWCLGLLVVLDLLLVATELAWLIAAWDELFFYQGLFQWPVFVTGQVTVLAYSFAFLAMAFVCNPRRGVVPTKWVSIPLVADCVLTLDWFVYACLTLLSIIPSLRTSIDPMSTWLVLEMVPYESLRGWLVLGFNLALCLAVAIILIRTRKYRLLAALFSASVILPYLWEWAYGQIYAQDSSDWEAGYRINSVVSMVLRTFYASILFWIWLVIDRIVPYPLGRCRACGYSTEGLSSPTCPECGTTIPS